MVTLTFENKTIKRTMSGQIYQNENNVDLIRCVLPKSYNNIDLNHFTVLLCYKNSENRGGYIELEKDPKPYDASSNQYWCKINSKLTSVAGDVIVWLRLYDDSNSCNLETSEIIFKVLPSKEIPKDGFIEDASYFDQWLIKMNQIKNLALNAVREATEQANVARQEARKIAERNE